MQQANSLLLRLVSRVGLFRQMDIDCVTALLQHASSVKFNAGDIVFEEGREGHSMYIVTEGAFEVFRQTDGKIITIAIIEAGQHFGEIALVANRPRSASVRAVRNSTAIRLSKRAVMGEEKAALQLFRNMANMLAKSLVSLNDEVILYRANAQAMAEPDGSSGESGHSHYSSVNR